MRTLEQLREEALEIWRAGLDAVASDRLVRDAIRVDNQALVIAGVPVPLDRLGRIAVVGAGKAGAKMAAAVERVLGPDIARRKRLTGWVNVPEDCLCRLNHIHLHGARPAGVNEPTPAGVDGAEQILRLVASLGPDDLCLCLISGGGSALLPAPIPGITLSDKLAVTRHLSGAGANIEELNTVRKQLSRVKGGGLARACRAGRLVGLMISDVPGDPLDVIASGPTVENPSTPEAALEVLERFHAREAGIREAVFEHLAQASSRTREKPARQVSDTCEVSNHVIGNNAMAVDAAGREAVRLGYSPAMVSARESEGAAEAVGRHLARAARRMRRGPGPDCLISGGEPVVTLVETSKRGLGGRNQQLVLAALETLGNEGAAGLVLLSGGTDGEDGPTDAAGAILTPSLPAMARNRGLDPADSLARNDAYHFFKPLGALIQTGPTHTNVCDLRVAVVDRVELKAR